eukprot:5505612-Alexandrium_andersonii.AAC.1
MGPIPLILRLRPIAIVSACVRAWNRVRAQQVARWMKEAYPACVAGGVPQRSVEQVVEPVL